MSSTERSVEQALQGERIAMVVTPDLRARPMTVASVEGDRVAFLTDRRAAWVQQLGEATPVGLAMADPDDSAYASLTGRASTSEDRELLERLWSVAANAWFDGVDDPNLVALVVDVTDGEWWDGPDSMVSSAVRGAAAVATGTGSDLLGDQGDVSA